MAGVARAQTPMERIDDARRAAATTFVYHWSRAVWRRSVSTFRRSRGSADKLANPSGVCASDGAWVCNDHPDIRRPQHPMPPWSYKCPFRMRHGASRLAGSSISAIDSGGPPWPAQSSVNRSFARTWAQPCFRVRLWPQRRFGRFQCRPQDRVASKASFHLRRRIT